MLAALIRRRCYAIVILPMISAAITLLPMLPKFMHTLCLIYAIIFAIISAAAYVARRRCRQRYACHITLDYAMLLLPYR